MLEIAATRWRSKATESRLYLLKNEEGLCVCLGVKEDGAEEYICIHTCTHIFKIENNFFSYNIV